MKKLLTLWFLLLTVNFITAQQNWQPGHIFRNGEKIVGEIDDREWPYHIDEISFREGKSGATQRYTAKDNIDFAVGGRRYVTEEVTVITNSRELDKLTVDTTKNREVVTAFLRQYYDGELSLYQYVDELKKRHFYLKMAGAPIRYLEYEKNLRAGAEKKILQTVNTYKFQLSELLSDCSELQASITDTDYALNDLRKLVKQWYQCRAISPDFTAKVAKGKISFAPNLHFIRTTMTAQFTDDRGTKSQEAHLGPAYGLSAKYILPGIQDKLSIRLEGYYHAFSDVSQSVSRQEGPVSIVFLRALDQSSIQISTIAEYKILSGNFPLYAELGYTTGIITNFDFLFAEVRTFADGSQLTLESQVDSQLADGNDTGVLLGLGTYYKDLQVGLRVTRTTRDRDSDKRLIYRIGLAVNYWL